MAASQMRRLVIATLMALVFGAGYVTAQSGTRWWKVDDTVRIIDTSGVCLYVYAWGYTGGIAAVPKTQLPPGTGCQ